MLRPRFSALTVLALITLCLAAAPSVTTAAATPRQSPVITDCEHNHGSLTESFSLGELHQALASIQTATQAYTNCYAAISDRLNAEEGHHTLSDRSTQGSGGGSATLIVVIIVVVVLLAGGGAAFWAYRRNRRTGS